MASFRKLPSGKWEAQVFVKGKRKSKAWATKREAERWAADTADALENDKVGVSGKTVGDLLQRYLEEVTPTKRGSRRESVALVRMMRDTELCSVPLEELAPRHIAAWRDRRLAEVSGSTVNRELNTLSNAFHIARREWQWLTAEITKDVRRPKSNAPRQRLPTDDEIEAICHALGDRLVSGRVRLAWLFALETGLRCGEICALQPGDVEGRVLTVRESKTDAGVRQVPMTSRAMEIWEEAGGDFGLVPAQVDANFRRARKLAGVEDLHFHDSRAASLTKLSKVLSPLQLAKVAGHKDMQMLINCYYRENVADLVAKLD
jgi:integrase